MIFLIYLWLCWVFSLVAESGGYSRCGAWTSHCGGFSWSRAWALGWVGFSSCDAAGSVVAAHGLSCSAPCGIFPDQGSNPRLLYQQEDSLPLAELPRKPCDGFWKWIAYFIELRVKAVGTTASHELVRCIQSSMEPSSKPELAAIIPLCGWRQEVREITN